MKKFYLFLASALVLGAFAVACNPDEPGPDNTYKGPVTGESVWSVTGSLSADEKVAMDWDNDIVMAEGEDGIFVVKNLLLAPADKFKIRKDKGWDVSRGGVFSELGKGFRVKNGGDDIAPNLEGLFDIYYNPAIEQMAICAKDAAPAWAEQGKAAKLLEFFLTNGKIKVEGEIFDKEKMVDVQFKPEEKLAITNATVEYKISDYATVTPDPTTIKDWTEDTEFTVTSEDGKTSTKYTVKCFPIEYNVALDPVSGVDGKLLTAMGANNDIAFYGGNQIAFSGGKNIVTSDRRVYNLNLEYVGDLNWGDILPEASMMSMGNDDYGVLIVAVGYGDGDFSAAPADDNGKNVWNFTNATRFYAWPDGWDKAPVQFYENPSCLMYMNVSGDFNDKMLITAKQGGNGETGFAHSGNHHLFHFDKGVVNSDKWQWFATGKEEVPCTGEMNFTSGAWRQGYTAGSTVCPLGVEKEDALFVWAQALSALSVEDPNYSVDKWGKDGNAGMIVAARQGYTGEDMILEGTAETVNSKTKPHRYGGLYGWGNHCITGSVKLFNYSGTVYAAVVGSNWNETHFTVLNISASTPGKTVAEISTNSFNNQTGSMPNGGLVSVAYVFDSEADTGHIVALSAYSGGEKEASSALRRYDFIRTKK